MANMLKYIIILFVAFGCKAQTIIPILSETYEDPTGGYLKDTFNDFDNFTGTWQYNSGGTTLTITLKKKINFYNASDNFHEDIVYGEYQYVENGVEKINTLSALVSPFPDPYSHNIEGNIINTSTAFPICTTCPPDQKRLHLSFSDPTRANINGLTGEIILRRVDSGGQQKLELWLRSAGHITYNEANPPQYTDLNVPWGTYVLTKQP